MVENLKGCVIRNMKKGIKYLLIILVLVCIGLFFYSYIGIDKETGVPKGLLMRIRPLPWEEIYWDEDDQLLKTAIIEETASGDQSRCLRIYKLTPSGLLMGGYQFRTYDSIGITNAFVDFEIENNVIMMFDQRSSTTLFSINIADICENSENFIGIYPRKVYYELGDEVILHVVLGYRTKDNESIIYHDKIPEIKAVVEYTDELSGGEKYELGMFFM